MAKKIEFRHQYPLNASANCDGNEGFTRLWKTWHETEFNDDIRIPQLKKANLPKGRDAKLPVFRVYPGQRGRQRIKVRFFPSSSIRAVLRQCESFSTGDFYRQSRQLKIMSLRLHFEGTMRNGCYSGKERIEDDLRIDYAICAQRVLNERFGGVGKFT